MMTSGVSSAIGRAIDNNVAPTSRIRETNPVFIEDEAPIRKSSFLAYPIPAGQPGRLQKRGNLAQNRQKKPETGETDWKLVRNRPKTGQKQVNQARNRRKNMPRAGINRPRSALGMIHGTPKNR